MTIKNIAEWPRQRLENEIRRRTHYAYLGGDHGLCRVLGRYKMHVDTRDSSVSSHLIMDGYWELWVTSFLANLVKPGMVAVDVGANLGYFTVLFADLVGKGGRVHAFEPNPPIADRLALSVHMNGFRPRVIGHVVALGDGAEAPQLLHIPEGYPGGARLVAASEEYQGPPVPVARMDAIEGLDRVDVVKIDAEGAEQAIWRGMAGVFARNPRMTVLLEFAASRYDQPAEFLAEIAAEGFMLRTLTLDGRCQSVSADQILRSDHDEEHMLVLSR